jgi:LytS/YehU family sensor histidine kinase
VESVQLVRKIFRTAENGTILAQSGEGGMGMGMVNVIQRLRLFSGDRDVMRIEQVVPNGTRIIISLPYRENT